MESLPKPGEVFDRTKLDEFFKINRTILPPDVSRDDVNVERDNKMRTVRILFDVGCVRSTRIDANGFSFPDHQELLPNKARQGMGLSVVHGFGILGKRGTHRGTQ